MKKVTRKALSLLLSIAMVFGMVESIGIFPVFAVMPPVSIGGTALTSGKYYTILLNTITASDSAPASGGYLYYTLNGAAATLAVTGGVTYSGTIPALSIADSTLTLTGSGNLDMESGSVPTVVGNSGSLVTSGYTGSLRFLSTAQSAITGCTDVTLETTGELVIHGKSSGTIISCDNNVTLKGSTVSLTNGMNGQLVETKGKNISITSTGSDLDLAGNADSPLLLADGGGQGANGTVTLSASGDIAVNNNIGPGMVVGGALTVSKAQNVTVAANSANPTVGGAANITADGGVSIQNTGSGMAVSGALTVSKAQRVTVTGAGSSPTIGGAANVTADGDVLIQNTGTGMAAGSDLTAASTNGSVTVEGKAAYAPAVSGAATITAATGITITSASAADIGGTAALHTGSGVIVRTTSVGTTITIDGKQVSVAYGGDMISQDLDISTPPTKATLYSVGSGYCLFTPVSGSTPAALTLHNVDTSWRIILPSTPMTLSLEGKNTVNEITASGAVTVSGSGSLDAHDVTNSDFSDALTINGGAALNAWYQTTDGSGVTTNTIYGRYTMNDGHGLTVDSDSKLALAPNAVLTLGMQGPITFRKNATLDEMTVGAGASIVNNGTVVLPKGTTVAQIRALHLTGSGMVGVASGYDSYGFPTAGDTYTNDGTALKTVTGDLDLTSGDYSSKRLDADGYTWDAAASTLTLKNVLIAGIITLPDNSTVKVDGAAYTGDLDGGSSGGALTVSGGRLTLLGNLDNMGDVTLTGVNFSGGIDNSNVNSDKVLTVKDSTITTPYFSWMANGGVSLQNSTLTVSNAFWAEKIAMDSASVINMNSELHNYNKVVNGLDGIKSYLPKGYTTGVKNTYNTILDSKGNIASGIVLKNQNTGNNDDNNSSNTSSAGNTNSNGNSGSTGGTASTPPQSQDSAADAKNSQTGDTSRTILPVVMVSMVSAISLFVILMRRRKKI